MRGNFHAQFLEGWTGAIPSGYSIAGCPPHRSGRALISASGSYLGCVVIGCKFVFCDLAAAQMASRIRFVEHVGPLLGGQCESARRTRELFPFLVEKPQAFNKLVRRLWKVRFIHSAGPNLLALAGHCGYLIF